MARGQRRYRPRNARMFSEDRCNGVNAVSHIQQPGRNGFGGQIVHMLDHHLNPWAHIQRRIGQSTGKYLVIRPIGLLQQEPQPRDGPPNSKAFAQGWRGVKPDRLGCRQNLVAGGFAHRMSSIQDTVEGRDRDARCLSKISDGGPAGQTHA